MALWLDSACLIDSQAVVIQQIQYTVCHKVCDRCLFDNKIAVYVECFAKRHSMPHECIKSVPRLASAVVFSTWHDHEHLLYRA